MVIVEIHNPEEKKEICRRVLNDLPDWFGIPEAVDAYIARSGSLPFWAAMEEEPLGFIVVQSTAPQAAEIDVMGVVRSHHRQGIGGQLVEQALVWCRKEGILYLQVKTLDDSHPDPRYADTRRFYEALGFVALESLPQIWGEENPCLIMVRHVG